jgi:hypothetical protein
MPKIDTYGTNTPVLAGDRAVGTNAAGETKNFSMEGIKTYAQLAGATGSFTAGSGETVTVTNGLITGIV